MTYTSYIWGYYNMITNHTIYVRRGTTSIVYFICKSRTNKTGSISRDTRSSRRQRPKNQKVTKVNESKQSMEGGLQEDSVEYGVSMPSPQLTQGWIPMIYLSSSPLVMPLARISLL